MTAPNLGLLVDQLEDAAYTLEKLARELTRAGADDLAAVASDLADRVEGLDAACGMRWAR